MVTQEWLIGILCLIAGAAIMKGINYILDTLHLHEERLRAVEKGVDRLASIEEKITEISEAVKQFAERHK